MKKFAIFGILLALAAALLFAGGSNTDDSTDRAWRGRGFHGPMWGFGGPGMFFELFEVDDEPGILVVRVLDDSAVRSAGLQRGDIVLRVGGTEVNSIPDIHKALEGFEPGQTVQLGISRGGTGRTLSVTLYARDDKPLLGFLGIGQMPEVTEIRREFRGPFGPGGPGFRRSPGYFIP